ncbi:PREDICTED: ribonuclease P protein subunit p25-like protein isoform X2 [Acropora digitifera]|uniref:ribonuclease P protein subunit p25-like protein isoform X2 n=1 Tax=Acropora digitifera TaxID=70779 RepID=UPI00077A58DA|nr:PREDICTED: ribonuclease P protein subunit p25-like protein isoform X2 [Acropora digitifera]
MDRYTKTSSVSSENQDTKEAGNIYVKSGSKIRNIISQAHKILQNKEEKKINLIGSGPSISKTITCAEIVKRKARGLHQLNALYYTKVEDTWEPKEESLDKYQAPGKSKSPVQFGDEDWNYLGKMILQRNPRKHQMDMLRRCQKV